MKRRKCWDGFDNEVDPAACVIPDPRDRELWMVQDVAKFYGKHLSDVARWISRDGMPVLGKIQIGNLPTGTWVMDSATVRDWARCRLGLWGRDERRAKFDQEQESA